MWESIRSKAQSVAGRERLSVRLGRRGLATLSASLCLLAGASSGAAAAPVTESASSGALSATFSYALGHDRYGNPEYSDMRLTIAHSGGTVYEGEVRAHLCDTACWPGQGYSSAKAKSVHVVQLAPAGEPSVVLDLYSGGAHCCYIEQVYSYSAAGNVVTMAEKTLGDPGASISRLGSAVRSYLVSADDRFAYAFTDFADSGLPLQIWAFEGGGFKDVTRDFPALVAKDAARQWHGFVRDRANGVGLFAAWAADEELLGRGGMVQSTLAREARRGQLRSALGEGGARFARKLKRMLRRWHYIR